ncbi:G-protein coupled GABA receptor [Fragilaria crotonensis]|nr:G-protein coupled GABA receptor [Fragilaria crotonensis]
MSFPQIMPGSAVIRLNATTRLIHIPIVVPFSYELDDGSFEVDGWDLSPTIGYYLAVKHFNDRNPAILDSLPALFQGCDIQISTEIYDSQYSPVVGSRYIAELLQRKNHSLETPYPAAIVGGAYSSEAKTAAVLTGVYGVPFISSWATSSELENRDVYKTFARVIPTDAGNALVIVEHFANLGVKAFGVIYVRNEFGENYVRDLRREAEKRGMRIESFWYETIDEALKPGSVEAAMADLQKTKLNYFFGIPYYTIPIEEVMMRAAYRAGIAGPGFVWFLNDPRLDQPVFNSDDREIIDAINGLGSLSLLPSVPSTAESVLMQFQFDTQLQDEFLDAVKNEGKQMFVNFNLTEEEPLYSFWFALAYDAILLPAYAACSIDKEFFSSDELFNAISQSEFIGSTGHILLSREAQTRDPASIQSSLDNFVIDEAASKDGIVRFKRRIVELIRYEEVNHGDTVNPFIYSDNSTNPPLPMPPLEVNFNLINSASRTSGLALCALVIVVALGWIAFTYLHRDAKYIRGSQPPFLYMLCIGVILMAASIIPMSLQEPMPTSSLNVSCMSQLWLLSAGFTTAFSALFCKIWRLNKLVRSSIRFKRMRVRIQDVLYPFAILLSLNFLLLTVWSVVDPLVWVRSDDYQFMTSGRASGSTAACASASKTNEIIFYSFFCVFNFAALGCANWQSYKARKLRTDFNENITLSMLLMTEAAMLGLPVLFLVGHDPSAFFVVRSVLITIISLGVLMPIFVPKVSLRNKTAPKATRVVAYRCHDDAATRRASGGSWWLGSSDDGTGSDIADVEPHSRLSRMRSLTSGRRLSGLGESTGRIQFDL